MWIAAIFGIIAIGVLLAIYEGHMDQKRFNALLKQSQLEEDDA